MGSQRIPFDGSELTHLSRQAAGFLALHEQMRALDMSPVAQMLTQWQREQELWRPQLPAFELAGALPRVSELLTFQAEAEQLRRNLLSPSFVEQVQEAARAADALNLPAALDSLRTPEGLLACKMLHIGSIELLRDPVCLDAFSRASAVSDLLAESTHVGAILREATQLFTLADLPSLGSLAAYRNFFDAAGLWLPRWPRRRLLSAAEKRRRFKAWLRENKEPAPVRQAKSLVHRYELTMREILDAVMASVYGEAWPEERLPLCDCNDLLGRWKNRGGDALDHADYVHYARIMSHPEHFEAVFVAGFDDPEAVNSLLIKAGKLRAASHHPGPFTPEDLRDLRLTWRTIETGLLALTPDYTFEWD